MVARVLFAEHEPSAVEEGKMSDSADIEAASTRSEGSL
jgi:hypothetical protein